MQELQQATQWALAAAKTTTISTKAISTQTTEEAKQAIQNIVSTIQEIAQALKQNLLRNVMDEVYMLNLLYCWYNKNKKNRAYI